MTKIDEQTLKEAVAKGIPTAGGYVPTTYTSPQDEEDNDESIQKRKGRSTAIEDYRKKYLCKTEVPGRQFIYVSEELHESLLDIVKVIGGKRATLGGYVENLLRDHLSEHKEMLNSVHKSKYKSPVKW